MPRSGAPRKDHPLLDSTLRYLLEQDRAGELENVTGKLNALADLTGLGESTVKRRWSEVRNEPPSEPEYNPFEDPNWVPFDPSGSMMADREAYDYQALKEFGRNVLNLGPDDPVPLTIEAFAEFTRNAIKGLKGR